MREWKGRLDGELLDMMREMNKEVGRSGWRMLKSGRQVSISHFVTFFIEKNKKDYQDKPHYDLDA